MNSLLEILYAQPTKPRRVYFGFHYQRDIWRVMQVKNHDVTKERNIAGYFDGSLTEKAKTQGESAVKRLINSGMEGSSVTCILIGAETFQRHWVDYEILRSIERGMGVFGVRIHRLKNRIGGIDVAGADPFDYLGYVRKVGETKLSPMVRYSNGWKDAPRNQQVSDTVAPYLNGRTSVTLSNLFKVYDWVSDRGYENFGTWVSRAARQAGR